MPYHGGPPNQPYQSPTAYHQGKFINFFYEIYSKLIDYF